MTTATLKRPAPPAALWRSLAVDEPLSLSVALVEDHFDLVAALRGLSRDGADRRTLVAALCPQEAPLDLHRVLDLAAAKARRVVLTYALATDSTAFAPAASADQLEAVRQAAEAGSAPLLCQPEPLQAVAGAMLGLTHGESLAVAWPAAHAAAVESLIAQGLRWRAAWDAPEDAGLYPLPPRSVG